MNDHTYKPEYARTAYATCVATGADERTLGSIFGVPEEIIWRWRAHHLDFREAIEKGKTVAQMQLAEVLLSAAANGSTEAQTYCRKEPSMVYGADLKHGRLEATFH